jgi:hypothetical protein
MADVMLSTKLRFVRREGGPPDRGQYRQAARAVALKATAAMGNDTKGGCNMPKLRLAARRSQLALARHQKRLQQECPRQFQFG